MLNVTEKLFGAAEHSEWGKTTGISLIEGQNEEEDKWVECLTSLTERRNQLLHEGKNITASETANFIRNYLGEIDGIDERTAVKQVVQMIKMGLHVGLTMVETEGDTLSVIRKLQSKGIDRSGIEGLKRNEETYLIGEVPAYAKEVAEKDLQQVGSTFPVDRNLSG
ncbi:hypothetical protein J1N35_000169 [Gossypium stocksii]|uniref:Uncharacterized protein n=1 Tax=Gossypium stocksii TaxID=47602 RepID=A0A9D4AK90_9ROSI|nr:hypothetical protein J1N35_000169 [Gossypium stocksii]